ncbi:hypothetical protein CBS147339_6385 [Penicillium roqueforti]|nr:hypothetical protein DTO012A8_8827 [Penicillium roqueforti]KAI3073620.1 hypothetical protein CBS147339_6385 [Penicillium roqueforti]KAI3092002.1 hypothetical protein CBS147338_7971 [Penicillium roqueforti]KAI3184973.1 hypothetical protein DTO032C6_5838 [Penicillium roqueforti]KAI3222834.1 hypothetical protein DTO012A9_9913 [Penicillium roqueforti]
MKSFYWALSALSLSLGQAAGYLVSPAGVAAPGSSEDCSLWYLYQEGSTCQAVEVLYEITAAQFEEWNPLVMDLGSSCEMLPDLYYCVQVNFVVGTYLPSSYLVAPSVPVPAAALSYIPSTTATPSLALTSIPSVPSTPSPIQTGMVSDCDEFYLVVSGDDCATIASDYDISLTNFYAWNPAVGSTCASLWVDDYVCVGVAASSSSAVVTTARATTFVTTTVTSGSSSAPSATPSPIESGMVDNCDAYHLVISGDECATIASDAGITLDEFYDWNPTVGDTCSSLWVGYYVCIGIS